METGDFDVGIAPDAGTGVSDFCRGINERIAGHADGDTVTLVCECARPGCFLDLIVPVAEFEAVAAAGSAAIVARGHGGQAVLVRREPGYDVVLLHLGSTPFDELLEHLRRSREASLGHPFVG